MSNLKLLFTANHKYLVNFDDEFTDLKHIGRFKTNVLHNQEEGVSFQLANHTCMLLKPTLQDLEDLIERGPQIIIPKDIAWISYRLGASSSEHIVEVGGGSGALTLALAQSLAPNGKLTVFEQSKKHLKILNKNIEKSPYKDSIVLVNEEFTSDTPTLKCDALFFDSPQPWNFVSWAKKSLVPGGLIMAYLPTTNQVLDFLNHLDGWQELELIENIQRDWKVDKNALRPKNMSLGHTGFIVNARNIDLH